MKLLRKIPAFTLTEMLVVLAISAVVIGLALSIISLFGKNVQLIQNNYSNSTKLDLFENQLTLDFNQFRTIQFSAIADKLLLKTPIDSIFYTFNENFVLRGSDTILKTPLTKTMYLFGEEINDGQIDAIKIQIGEEKTNRFVFICKVNDANHYMSENGD